MKKEAQVEVKARKQSRTQSRRIWLLPLYAAFFNLVCNVVRSVGILYVAIIDAEQFTRQQASWPGSVNGAVSILFGPVVGMLNARWTANQLTSCGVFMSVIGFAACYFSTNLYVLIIFYGVIRGCGMTALWLTLPVVINTVFEENRALAMSITGMGRSVGGFVWPYVLQFLLETYALKGTFLIMGGISMHGFIAAVGLLAFNIHSKPYREEKVPIELKPMISKRAPSPRDSCDIPKEKTGIPEVVQSGDNPKQSSSSTSSRPEEEIIEVNLHMKTNDTEENREFIDSKSKDEKPPYFNPRIIKNIFTCRGFYLITVTRVFLVFVTLTYMEVHVDYLGDKNIPIEDALNMIVAYSSGDLIGLLCLHWITDKKYLSRQFYTSVSFTVGGAVILLLTLTNHLAVLLSCAFLLGLFEGSTLTIQTVIVADYMRKDEMSLALAFARSINGAIAILRAPVIGYFRDVLGTYDYLFRIYSSCFAFIAVMWLVEGLFILKKKKNGSEIKDAQNEDEEGKI